MFWCISYYLCALGTFWLPYESWCKTGRTSAKIRATNSRRTFRNECTRSSPLDNKLMFWCISYYLCAFGTVWLPDETRCKTGRTITKVCSTKSRRTFRNEHTRSTPLYPKLVFWGVSFYLCAFGTVWLPYEIGGKRTELLQKFVPRCRVGIFCNEHTQSTTLDHELTFWYVLYYLGAFGTVWLPYETRCKTGRTSAKVRATKSRRNFSHRTPPIHPIAP